LLVENKTENARTDRLALRTHLHNSFNKTNSPTSVEEYYALVDSYGTDAGEQTGSQPRPTQAYCTVQYCRWVDAGVSRWVGPYCCGQLINLIYVRRYSSSIRGN